MTMARIKRALDYAVRYGGIDGDHHKAWVIDQMVRALTGCPMVKRNAIDCNNKPYEYEGQGESDEYKQLGKEIGTLYTQQLYSLGTSVAPRVIILSNRLGNTPTEGMFSGDYSFWVPYRGDQWYIR